MPIEKGGWIGTLAKENAQDVAQAIKARLNGRYTSVTVADGTLNARDVRTSQVLNSITVHDSGGLTLWDTAGGYCLSAGASIELTWEGARFEQPAGGGAQLVWVFKREKVLIPCPGTSPMATSE